AAVSYLDAPAGVTQEEDHREAFLPHCRAVFALFFFARTRPLLSLIEFGCTRNHGKCFVHYQERWVSSQQFAGKARQQMYVLNPSVTYTHVMAVRFYNVAHLSTKE
ncbi:unnamed protein product, partial [Ectocarpus sp. 12 AP-2014]